MADSDAQSVLDRVESDESFGARLQETGADGGPEAALAFLRAEGFDVTADEMRDRLVDRYGDQLTQEQLDALAGGRVSGDDLSAIIALAGLGGATIGVAVAGAAVV